MILGLSIAIHVSHCTVLNAISCYNMLQYTRFVPCFSIGATQLTVSLQFSPRVRIHFCMRKNYCPPQEVSMYVRCQKMFIARRVGIVIILCVTRQTYRSHLYRRINASLCVVSHILTTLQSMQGTCIGRTPCDKVLLRILLN